jgi:probable phosphoglycerate mutase
VALSATGEAQADRLGQILAACPLTAIYTSPLQRAVQTAKAIARYQAAPVRRSNALVEIDFGLWTGKTFTELEHDEAWQRFNTRRSMASIPDGEAPSVVQARIVAEVSRLSAFHAGAVIALVSHGDVLRFALLYYVGATLDDYSRFNVDPASVTALSVSPRETRLLLINGRNSPRQLGT